MKGSSYGGRERVSVSFSFAFFANALLLGVALAMDAFSVSLVNGLNAPDMPFEHMALIAATFSLFQFLMPLVGWLCVRAVSEAFQAVQRALPWIASALLGYIGGRMLWEGSAPAIHDIPASALDGGALLAQAVATSIDALSAGLTIESYSPLQALAAALVIATVTFTLCMLGVSAGRKFGAGLSGGASLLGGAILTLIGLRIFLIR